MSYKKENGQSIIEFVIAVGVLIIVGGSGALAILSSLTATRLAKEQTQASGYAQEGLEAVKSIRNQDWNNLVDGTYGLDDSLGYWQFSGTSDISEEKFTRTITIEDATIEGEIENETKMITSNVSWDYNAKTSQVEYVTYLTNWRTLRAAPPGGYEYGTCPDYCSSLGYASGQCEQNPTQCATGEEYKPFGDQFCLTGPSADTCCCNL